MNDRFLFRAFYEGRFIYKNLIDANYYTYDNKCIGLANTLPNSLKWEQCTGLKDKNGKLIYEGDIVRARNPSKTIYDKLTVTYEIFSSAFMMSNGDKLKNYLGVFFAKDWCWDIEVISNIHETPKLLEQKDEKIQN